MRVAGNLIVAFAALALLGTTRPTMAQAPGEMFRDCTDCPEMIALPAGSFAMGSSPSEIAGFSAEVGDGGDHFREEGPRHDVVIGTPFAAGKFEVTFDEWQACVAAGGCTTAAADEGWGRGRRPVINVSWDDAKQFASWLSKLSGKNYRLLSESEWEFAARAGSNGRYGWGDTASHEQANYGTDQCCDGLSQGLDSWDNSAPVGSFPANAFGLHDMLGNVGEWVEDCSGIASGYDAGPATEVAQVTPACDSHGVRGGS